VSLLVQITSALKRTVAFGQAIRAADERRDFTLAIPGTVRPIVAAALFSEHPGPTLLVMAGEEAAERFGRQLTAFLGAHSVLRYPDREEMPWSRETSDPRAVGRRARAVHALEKGRDVIVIASARSLLRRIPPQGSQFYDPLVLDLGLEMDLEETVSRLARMGYSRVDAVEGVGEFAVRGGILDVYPSDATHPARVELLGDKIESVRGFVAATGQSLMDAGLIEVFPCREIRLSARAARAAQTAFEDEAKMDEDIARDLDMISQGIQFDGVEAYLPVFYPSPGRLTDYLTPDATMLIIEPRSLLDDASRRYEDVASRAGAASAVISQHFLRPNDLDLGGHRRVTFLSFLMAGGAVDGAIEARRPDVAAGEQGLVDAVASLRGAGLVVVVTARDEGMRERMTSLLSTAGSAVEYVETAVTRSEDLVAKAPGGIGLAVADVPTGFVLREAGLAVISADDVFPRSSRSAPSSRGGRRGEIALDYAPGDYVVHQTHGVALFKQVVRKTVLGAERDYVLLEYAHGDRLFVPIDQIDRVTRYIGPDSSAPRLTRLDTADWSRALGKARKSARRLAFDLVELYAQRATVEGFAYGPDTPWQNEMEDAFPFDETVDQLEAIRVVKADMRSPRPMDRLVAGDVGYGKTEVAVRAAFKAVQDGKQVMILCPTTVLAQQHYVTFSERFAPFPVRVDVISRFRTKAEQRATLDTFSEGKVDVLIGTHRLLSSDVMPHDLGLVIVDEEQRFGVQQKEQFKHLRAQVDVLALSATPIPRTLQMALSGVRDLSIIDTPPADRFPVQVRVGEYDEDLVQAAIRAEMERGGQVYYIYNRVSDIEGAVERVRSVVPEARIGVGHGQMTEKQLERVMESFSAGEYDVLVSTTIVESGLDNPHTNTLIIEDSQRLGLAQLYQLKGRVGRSHVRAHAYFFFPRTSTLTEEAYDRLAAIGEHTELGSGLQIAMRDLEIRGAGTMLGAEQHGSLSALGFELYAHMLREAVSEARGESVPESHEVRIDLPVPAFLPEEYVPAVDRRVRYYRRLAAALTPEAVAGLWSEMEQTHGGLPVEARDLFAMARIRVVAVDLGIENISVVRHRLVLKPISLDAAQRGRLSARFRAVWTGSNKKLAIPLEGEDVTASVEALLTETASILRA